MYQNLLVLFLLNALLLGLSFPIQGHLGPAWLALEAVWIVAALMLATATWRRWLAALTALALALLALLAILDALAQVSLGRAFNPLLDFGLADSAYHLMAQNLGGFPALLITLGAFAALGLSTYLAYLALGRVRGPHLPAGWRIAAGLLLLSLLAPLLPRVPDVPAWSGRVATPALDLIASHWRQVRETRTALADFQQRLADDDTLMARALPGLEGRDVTLGFIESYGVSAIFDARYAPLIRPRLMDMQQRLRDAGLHIATGRLKSPVQGGQSWLAHATLLSGLWLPSQRHYELLLAQRYPTLIDDFQATGHHALAVMPAITEPWPEGRQLGYDTILAAKDIDYAGPSLNWVTMPDQFTWHYFERFRQRFDEPLFSELALISSHAPWTPILPVIDDWSALDNGEIFMRWEDSGIAPEELWQDPQRVREHYARAVDYALAVMTGYAERYLNDDSLLIVLGDHQPAPLITGPDASRDVPIHVISADPKLIAPFIDAGFIAGAIPRAAPSTRRLDDWRPLLHDLFGEEGIDTQKKEAGFLGEERSAS
ncbi:MAG TPA: alkaline phosphatase [Modicisalibacter sp.]|nr:alkaline phosphatase [Modicisalibacter sp.]